MATETALKTGLPKTALPANWSVADLQDHLGGIPAERIRIYPPPGMASVDDVVRIEAREDRLCELVDGILVEKTMGWYESLLAVVIVTRLNSFVGSHNLGKVLGADGTLQIQLDMVRIPDVCFIGWSRFPDGRLPKDEPIPHLVPDLAIEVLSKSNTKGEMERKLNDYFEASVRLVWYIDPQTRSARAFTSVENVTDIPVDGVLDGADVLPGFELSLSDLFAEADRQRPSK